MTPYFDDDGTEVAPDMYPKPGLCLICKKLEDANEIMLCNLNRIDQRKERDFKCGRLIRLKNKGVLFKVMNN